MRINLAAIILGFYRPKVYRTVLALTAVAALISCSSQEDLRMIPASQSGAIGNVQGSKIDNKRPVGPVRFYKPAPTGQLLALHDPRLLSILPIFVAKARG